MQNRIYIYSMYFEIRSRFDRYRTLIIIKIIIIQIDRVYIRYSYIRVSYYSKKKKENEEKNTLIEQINYGKQFFRALCIFFRRFRTRRKIIYYTRNQNETDTKSHNICIIVTDDLVLCIAQVVRFGCIISYDNRSVEKNFGT